MYTLTHNYTYIHIHSFVSGSSGIQCIVGSSRMNITTTSMMLRMYYYYYFL